VSKFSGLKTGIDKALDDAKGAVTGFVAEVASAFGGINLAPFVTAITTGLTSGTAQMTTFKGNVPTFVAEVASAFGGINLNTFITAFTTGLTSVTVQMTTFKGIVQGVATSLGLDLSIAKTQAVVFATTTQNALNNLNVMNLVTALNNGLSMITTTCFSTLHGPMGIEKREH